MRHRVVKNNFGRRPGPRKALIRALVDSLVKYERIKTTLPKAKVLRSYVERAVTVGKKNDVHAVRSLLQKYPNKDTVKKITSNLSPRFEGRPGGYTRIIKLGPRPGDSAPMAYIEFVDFNPENPIETHKPQDFSRALKLRKSKRETQEKSRIINRK